MYFCSDLLTILKQKIKKRKKRQRKLRERDAMKFGSSEYFKVKFVKIF